MIQNLGIGSYSLVNMGIGLAEGETLAAWRERVAREKEERNAKIKEEISKLGLDAEAVIETCKEQFQAEANDARPMYADKYDDGGADFSVMDEWESGDFYLSIDGKGTAYKSRGMRGDQYLTPDDPDEITYNAHSATLTIYKNNEQVGEWDVTSLL